LARSGDPIAIIAARVGLLLSAKQDLLCRRKIEMSPGVQSRNDTAIGGGADKLGMMVSLVLLRD
jgi:hypothetical protein